MGSTFQRSDEARWQFSGRVVLITGAGSGIGRAIAIAVANSGGHVVAVGRRSVPLEETREECNRIGTEALAAKADIGRIDEVTEAVDRTILKFGRLDAIVNNAGIARFAPIDSASLGDLEFMLDAHLRGPINLIRAALPHLRAAGGVIVNVSSVAGLSGTPGRSFYGATKAALNHLTRSLALELAPEVRVNAVLPGPVNTPIYDSLGYQKEELDAFREDLLCRTPLKRFAEPDEIATWVCLLLSTESRWVTGTLICVDGGRSA